MIETMLCEDGYLLDYTQWTYEIAVEIAALDSIPFGETQQVLVEAIREFYDTFELSPTMKVFLNFMQNKNDAFKTYSSLKLMDDFPGRGSPMKRLCRIAGLPKPTNCF